MHEFPVERSVKWLNNIFLQFRKFVNDNNLIRVKVLTNLWLSDGNQHSFPIKTPEDNHIPSAKARLDKDFEFEELNKKYESKEEKDIFSALNCKVTDLLSSPDRKSIVTSLKRVSTSLMTCQKLYSEHYDRYGKQEIESFNQIMDMKMLDQEKSEKNLKLETQVARLEATIDKLRFQIRQKNMHEADLRKTYSAQKREQKALSENSILKLQQELMKIKNEKTTKKDTTRLEVERLKESLKLSKTLHKEQLHMKDARIAEQNSTIKTMKAKVRQLEKSLTSVESKFTAFQRKAASNIAKLGNKRELFEVKEQAKRDSEMKKKEQKEREKEMQKRRLQDAISLHRHLSPSVNSKKYQEHIINNFRTNSYLPSSFDYSQVHLSEESHPFASSRSNLTDHIGREFSYLDSATTPDFESFMRSSFAGEKRERKKSKLMQVSVDRTRSALDKVQTQKTIELTNDDTSTSTGINIDDDSADSDDMKMPALSSSNEKKFASQEQKDEVSSTNSVQSENLL